MHYLQKKYFKSIWSHYFINFLCLSGVTKPVDPPALQAYYDCLSEQGLLVIEWDCAVDGLDLACMRFHMLSTKEDKYQWKVQEDKIQWIKTPLVHDISNFQR